MNKAEKGRKLLIEKADRYVLALDYAPELNYIALSLCDMDKTKEGDEGEELEVICDTFDLSSIFEQVADVIERNERECYSFYRNGHDKPAFTGTPQDIARWYCSHEGIKLYIEPSAEGATFKGLYATFPDSKPDEQTYIAGFEDMPDDIETAFKLFFTEYLLDVSDADFRIEQN